MSPDNLILIHIDDQPVQIEKGSTILQAARMNGIEIPTLCDLPGLPPLGGCRMCIVEIEGWRNTPTSCSTPVLEGMQIHTHSPKVVASRRDLLQMLLAKHPSGCLFCPERNACDECMVTMRKVSVTTGCGSCSKDNQCELQALAEKYGVEKPVFPIHYRLLPVQKHDPFFDMDPNLCIQCGRCIRICEELHFVSSLAYTQRGAQIQVSTGLYHTHLESPCTFCGSCVEVCPTGALSEKVRKWEGKSEREAATTCPLCSIGCQIQLQINRDRVIGSLPNHLVGTSALCVKGRFAIPELVNHPTRLKHPQVRMDSFFMATAWEEAIHAAAQKLAGCDSNRFAIQISGSSTIEDLFVARQFTRQVMNSKNITVPEMDQYEDVLGIVARLTGISHPLEEVQDAPAVLCLGVEDPYAQSVVEVYLHKAKKHGARIIQLCSNKLSWNVHTDEWLQVEKDGEQALLQSLVEATGGDMAGEMESAVERAAGILLRSKTPMILLGPAVLVHPENVALLALVERLVLNLNARVVTLPEQINLVGAVRLGITESLPRVKELDVLFVIGEDYAGLQSGNPFVLYHNLYPPGNQSTIDLMLPATAFTETGGTYIDYAGRTRSIQPAVSPSGESMPAWMVLSRIAQEMGVKGFEFTCVEDIWQAAREEIPGFPEIPSGDMLLKDTPSSDAATQTSSSSNQRDYPSSQSYMGFPLVQRVGGMISLYPQKDGGGSS